MMIFSGILLILSFVLFLLAGFRVGGPPPATRFDLLAFGLASFVLSLILSTGPKLFTP